MIGDWKYGNTQSWEELRKNDTHQFSEAFVLSQVREAYERGFKVVVGSDVCATDCWTFRTIPV